MHRKIDLGVAQASTRPWTQIAASEGVFALTCASAEGSRLEVFG